jgi:mono/diheme cytochrome c family protein
MNLRFPILAWTCLSLTAVAVENPVTANHAAEMQKGLALFDGGVAQLLTEHCVKCHGGEKGTKGGFDLSSRDTAMKEGDTGKGVVPGKSAESLLVVSIRHSDPDLKMPKKADKLSDDAIAKITQWVDLGAPFSKPLVAGHVARDKSKVTDDDRKFWSFQPLADPQPPAVKNEVWCRTPIDRFILAKIEEKGLAPSGAAEKTKLIRRAYLDLIGLPPTPAQVDKFVADNAPEAFEKVVDELLANPHYGERWGRHWLDLARYAESHGYEQDYDRPNAYHYRDYVIRALNADQPYDEFVRWQVAGDELAPENPEAWKATGFLAAGTHATQITANQAEKERYDELDDMAATVGNAVLGLSVGCARCHDHKFDPIPTSDYYRFISTFTTAVRSDYDIEVNAAESRAKHAAWQKEHAPLTTALTTWEKEQAPAHFEQWRQGSPALPQPEWFSFAAEKLAVSGTYYVLSKQQKQPDDSYLIGVTAGTPQTYTFTTKLKDTRLAALRLEALLDKTLPGHGPGWAPGGTFNISEISATAKLPDGKTKTLIDAAKKLSWVIKTGGERSEKVFAFAEPLEAAGDVELTVTLKFGGGLGRHNLGRFRVSGSPEPKAREDAAAFSYKDFLAAREALAKPESAKPEQTAALSRLFCTTDPQWQELATTIRTHERAEPRGEFVKALVCAEGLPAVRLHTQGPDFYDKTFLLKRGDLNQKQGEAAPGFLQVVTRAEESRWVAPPAPESRTPRKRTALAKWLTDTDAGAGHLTARVIVNRLWQHHLGRGIVSTPSDFGAQGEKPSHPELLDWLARELIRGGWKLKGLHKQIMLSGVYQLSSYAAPAAQTADPDNTLFSRRQRQRLEGETIRDSILAVSGMLDPQMFGAGTLDAGMKRRSIYFQIKRSQLPPMMVTFDAPDTLQSMGQRSSTTVAPQSLLLLNNALVRTAAQTWAQRLDAQKLIPRDKIYRVYREGLGRIPTPHEEAAVHRFLEQQTESRKASGTQAAAWTDLCQLIFGLNEFLYVD